MHRIQVLRHLHATEPAYAKRARMLRRVLVIALSFLALGMCSASGCALLPSGFSGAWEPTPHTFRLTPEDLAAASDPACQQRWATGDDDEDLAEAMRRLDAAGYRVRVKRLGLSRFAQTYRTVIAVPKDFESRGAGDRARWLAHELVHVCQREQLGDLEFESALAHSAGRWRLETAGYATTAWWRAKQGQSTESLDAWMAEKLDDFRDDYALHDIDPAQYQQATMRVWLDAAEQR